MPVNHRQYEKVWASSCTVWLSEQPVDLGLKGLGLDKAHRLEVKAATISRN